MTNNLLRNVRDLRILPIGCDIKAILTGPNLTFLAKLVNNCVLQTYTKYY